MNTREVSTIVSSSTYKDENKKLEDESFRRKTVCSLYVFAALSIVLLIAGVFLLSPAVIFSLIFLSLQETDLFASFYVALPSIIFICLVLLAYYCGIKNVAISFKCAKNFGDVEAYNGITTIGLVVLLGYVALSFLFASIYTGETFSYIPLPYMIFYWIYSGVLCGTIIGSFVLAQIMRKNILNLNISKSTIEKLDWEEPIIDREIEKENAESIDSCVLPYTRVSIKLPNSLIEEVSNLNQDLNYEGEEKIYRDLIKEGLRNFADKEKENKKENQGEEQEDEENKQAEE